MKRSDVLGELITFKSTKGLHLDGILYQSNKNTKTIIHIHGSFGNFYQYHFVRHMARSYMEAGINFLSFNLAGHDGFGEGYRNIDDFEYVGGAVSDFGECVADIEGAIIFAKEFSNEVVLQGHSLGCDRILHFLITTSSRYDFILFSPCDSYQLQSNWIYPETVGQQISRLKREGTLRQLDWLSLQEYGIKQSEWTYTIPVTRAGLLSILEGPPFKLMNISNPSEFFLDQRALVYIGGKDLLQTVSADVMYGYLEKRIRDVRRAYFEKGDHNLAGCEDELIETVLRWVKEAD